MPFFTLEIRASRPAFPQGSLLNFPHKKFLNWERYSNMVNDINLLNSHEKLED